MSQLAQGLGTKQRLTEDVQYCGPYVEQCADIVKVAALQLAISVAEVAKDWGKNLLQTTGCRLINSERI